MTARFKKTDVRTKTTAQLDRATALKWAERAIDAYHLYRETGKQKYLVDAEDHRGEALEHAGKVGDYGKTVGVMQRKIDKHRVQ